jgi:hypothetical protein
LGLARDKGARETHLTKRQRMGLKKTLLRFFKKKNFHFKLSKLETHTTLFQTANVYKFSDLIVVDKGLKQSCKMGLMILIQNVFLNNYYMHSGWYLAHLVM